MLISESCIVNELPVMSAARPDNGYSVTPLASITSPSSPDSTLVRFKGIGLTRSSKKQNKKNSILFYLTSHFYLKCNTLNLVLTRHFFQSQGGEKVEASLPYC